MALCQKAIKRRFESGVEQAHFILNNPNNQFDSSIQAKEYVIYYFLNVLMGIERYDSSTVKKGYTKMINYLTDVTGKEKARWKNRLWLLKQMVITVNDKELEEEDFEWSVINSMNNLPHFETYIFLGSYAVKKEQFSLAGTFFSKVKEYEKNEFQKAISAANYGAFYFYQNDLDSSKNSYQEALYYAEHLNEKDLPIVEKERLTREIKLNLSTIERLISSLVGTFEEPKVKIPYKRQENELLKVDRHLNSASNYVRKEIYEINLKPRTAFRSSNNIFDADRMFFLSERNFQVMGSVNGVLGNIQRKLQEYVNIGYSMNDSFLLRIALYEAVKVNEEKAIKQIILNRFPFHEEKQLEEFILWLLSVSTSRNLIIGKIFAFEALADYIPESLLKQVKVLLLEAFNQNYSFFKTFDYKRPAIRALGVLIPRLQIIDQEDIITLLLDEWENAHFHVRHELGKTLSRINNWNRFHSSFHNKLIHKCFVLLNKIDKRDRDYQYLIELIINLSEFVSEGAKKEATQLISRNWKDGRHDVYLAFLQPWLRIFIEKQEIDSFEQWIIDKAASELIGNKSGVVSISAYNFGVLLALAIPFMKEQDRCIEGIETLVNYVRSKKIQPIQRHEALNAIAAVHQEGNGYLSSKQLKELALPLLEETQITNQSSKLDIFGDQNEVSVILTGAFRLLAFADLSLDEQLTVFDSFIEKIILCEGHSKSESIISIGRYCTNFNHNKELCWRALQYLIMQAKDSDERVRSAVAYWLPKIAVFFEKSSSQRKLAFRVIEHLVSDHHRTVRINLALSLGKFNDEEDEELLSLLEKMSKDFSHYVREASAGKKVEL